MILASVLAGLLIGFVWEWFRERVHRSEARVERRERSRLEAEVASLKGRAREGQDEVLALLEDQPRKAG